MHHFDTWDCSVSIWRAAPFSLERLVLLFSANAFTFCFTGTNMSEITRPAPGEVSAQKPQIVPLAADPVKITRQINFYYKMCWLGMVIGFPSLFLLPVGFIGFITAWAVLFGLYYGFHLLHLLWTLIPADIARTSPSRAVGYSFIPFFTCYWSFITYQGLAEDMNKILEQHSLQYRVNENMGKTLAVLVCLVHVPVINIFSIAIGGIIWVLFLKSAKNGALVLLEQEKQ
jgi:hypothetical protein